VAILSLSNPLIAVSARPQAMAAAWSRIGPAWDMIASLRRQAAGNRCEYADVGIGDFL